MTSDLEIWTSVNFMTLQSPFFTLRVCHMVFSVMSLVESQRNNVDAQMGRDFSPTDCLSHVETIQTH